MPLPTVHNKAALNMMTKTSAPALARDDFIFMTSVDTGWVNDENPLEVASRSAEASGFMTPIDELDAAARVLDPLFAGINWARGLNGGGDDRDCGVGGGGGGSGNVGSGVCVGGDAAGSSGLASGVFLKDYFETEW